MDQKKKFIPLFKLAAIAGSVNVKAPDKTDNKGVKSEKRQGDHGKKR